jgi:hypothetical protein
MNEHPVKKYPTLGCCGLDCGLCIRYYTAGSSRCPGCAGADFSNKHPSCSYVTCCFKKKNLEVCARCDEFPCIKFESMFSGGEKYDSFITYGKVSDNLEFIRKHGLEKFMAQQRKRISLLETMINKFDDGRSKNFYCLAAALLSTEDIEIALNKAGEKIKESNVKPEDLKSRAGILKKFLNEFASENRIELKLRKKK